MSLSREQAAQALGMKVREIIAVDRVDSGYAVTTHDGQRTLVDAHGQRVDRDAVHPAPAGDPVTPATPADPATPVAPAVTEVPDGTADAVLKWVDGDPQRAQAALAAENAREKPRTTLVEALERLTQG
ncbi:hypothetical protein ACIA59_20185 [Micromonospora haikouensis]|uniref:hypothetical protein n=1 Tax=Micromonospora haikouensis TaxID=686309 RepID=UPI00379E3A33